MVFVFGSNEAGRHGAGAARVALKSHGAIYGQGEGPQGNSYGIPTKDSDLQVLSLVAIKRYIVRFQDYANRHPGQFFQVTRIGCGLAGYTTIQIAPTVLNSPSNCYFEEAWKPYLGNVNYWSLNENPSS